jgi:hypothetical protein
MLVSFRSFQSSFITNRLPPPYSTIAVLSVDIAAEVGRIVVDTSTRAHVSSSILPSPVVMDVVRDTDCMSASACCSLYPTLFHSRPFTREQLQRWAAATNSQEDQQRDRLGGDAQPLVELVLPVSLAQLRQRYNAPPRLCASSGGLAIVEQVSILCATWNM